MLICESINILMSIRSLSGARSLCERFDWVQSDFNYSNMLSRPLWEGNLSSINGNWHITSIHCRQIDFFLTFFFVHSTPLNSIIFIFSCVVFCCEIKKRKKYLNLDLIVGKVWEFCHVLIFKKLNFIVCRKIF